MSQGLTLLAGTAAGVLGQLLVQEARGGPQPLPLTLMELQTKGVAWEARLQAASPPASAGEGAQVTAAPGNRSLATVGSFSNDVTARLRPNMAQAP